MDVMSQLPTWKSGRIPAFQSHGMYDFTLVYTGFSYKVESTGFMQLAFLIFYCQTSNYYKLISNNPLTAFPPLLSISEVTNIPDGQKDTHCKKKKNSWASSYSNHEFI